MKGKNCKDDIQVSGLHMAELISEEYEMEELKRWLT